MAFPKKNDLRIAIYEYLNANRTTTYSSIKENVINTFSLTEEEQNVIIKKSKQNKLDKSINECLIELQSKNIIDCNGEDYQFQKEKTTNTRGNFTFQLDFNNNNTINNIFDCDYVYWSRVIKNIQRTHSDHITITNNYIKIEGNRSDKKSLSFTFDNTIFNEVWKCLVFVYLTLGTKIKLLNCSLTYNSVEVVDNNIDDLDLKYFSKPLDENLKIDFNTTKYLFDNNVSAPLLSSFTLFIISLYGNNEELSTYWQAYDAFYKFVSGKSLDSEALSVISNYTKQFKSKSYQSYKFMKEFEKSNSEKLSKFINMFYIVKNDKNLFDNNTIKDENKNTVVNPDKWIRFKNMIDTFSDPIIYDNLKKCLSNKKFNCDVPKGFDPSDENVKKAIKNQEKDLEYIINKITTSKIKRDTTHLKITFLVTKLIYLKRCEYFHGKTANPSFLLKNNSRLEENKFYNELIKYVLVDLYNSDLVEKASNKQNNK